ncbi:hypothetical protein [Pedobacter sp. AJM]|nr:hypothetical protein [Pedobacter sp. AJM]
MAMGNRIYRSLTAQQLTGCLVTEPVKANLIKNVDPYSENADTRNMD